MQTVLVCVILCVTKTCNPQSNILDMSNDMTSTALEQACEQYKNSLGHTERERLWFQSYFAHSLLKFEIICGQ